MDEIALEVKGESKKCRILVDGRAKEAMEIADALHPSKIAIICSPNTRRIAEGLADEAKNAAIIQVSDGERAKNLGSVERLYSSFLKARLNRKSVAIIVGGGSLGDTAAFACSTFMRGIRFIQVPTTLLAMADSSIGGKNGVNFMGKNLVGTFAQPSAVVIDFSLLKTLPRAQIQNGIAEIVKCGCIRDGALFSFMGKNAGKIIGLEAEALEFAVSRAIKIKMGIVSKDETEELHGSGKGRMLLNFGHTVGHALERISNYGLQHGEAVAIGMVKEAEICERLGICEIGTSEKIGKLLEKFGLPTRIAGKIPLQKLVARMRLDKKNISGKIRLAGLRKIGEGTIVENVDERMIRGVLGR
ncbi:MAG: 3-dehydroquinate synthase [Candidatus Micrarchaeota archaeon]